MICPSATGDNDAKNLAPGPFDVIAHGMWSPSYLRSDCGSMLCLVRAQFWRAKNSGDVRLREEAEFAGFQLFVREVADAGADQLDDLVF